MKVEKAYPDAYNQRPGEGLEELMLASNTYFVGQELFDGKSKLSETYMTD
jgi:hypothetical protein